MGSLYCRGTTLQSCTSSKKKNTNYLRYLMLVLTHLNRVVIDLSCNMTVHNSTPTFHKMAEEEDEDSNYKSSFVHILAGINPG